MVVKMMEFDVNGLTWTIEQVNDNTVELNNEEGTFAGVTDYLNLHISIRNGMAAVVTRRTVIHELVHCFIWSYGIYTERYDNEQVCYFCENHLDHILEIADRYMRCVLHEQTDQRSSDNSAER